MKRYVLSREWKSEWVMDAESGDEKDGLTSEWGGESRQVCWGWRNESRRWYQTWGDAEMILLGCETRARIGLITAAVWDVVVQQEARLSRWCPGLIVSRRSPRRPLSVQDCWWWSPEGCGVRNCTHENQGLQQFEHGKIRTGRLPVPILLLLLLLLAMY